MTVSATGRVSRMYPNKGGCYVKLEGIPEVPKDGYFRLKLDHPNYKALYALIMSAAINRFELRIRTVQDIDPTEHAEVSYLVVDW